MSSLRHHTGILTPGKIYRRRFGGTVQWVSSNLNDCLSSALQEKENLVHDEQVLQALYAGSTPVKGFYKNIPATALREIRFKFAGRKEWGLILFTFSEMRVVSACVFLSWERNAECSVCPAENVASILGVC